MHRVFEHSLLRDTKHRAVPLQQQCGKWAPTYCSACARLTARMQRVRAVYGLGMPDLRKAIAAGELHIFAREHGLQLPEDLHMPPGAPTQRNANACLGAKDPAAPSHAAAGRHSETGQASEPTAAAHGEQLPTRPHELQQGAAASLTPSPAQLTASGRLYVQEPVAVPSAEQAPLPASASAVVPPPRTAQVRFEQLRSGMISWPVRRLYAYLLLSATNAAVLHAQSRPAPWRVLAANHTVLRSWPTDRY